MKSKKAMSVNFLVGLIITLAAFLLIGFALKEFLAQAGSKESEILCHDSIALRAAATLNVEGIGKARLTPLLCKTNDIKIKGNKGEVKKQLADLMARCWWIFHQGKYEELLKGGFKSILEFSTHNDCFMCYAVMIDKAEDWESFSQEEFAQYLIKNNYTQASQSYLNYIQSSGGPGRVLMLGEDNEIKAGQAYGISFAAKNREPQNLAYKVGAVAGGIALIFISGPLGGVPLIGGFLGSTLLGSGLALTVGGSAYLTADVIKKLATEREVSSLYLSDIDTAQKYCFSGDLAGK